MDLFTAAQVKILRLLQKQNPLTADQICTELGLAKTAARRTLLILERRGLLSRQWQPAARGRPKLAFQLAKASDKIFRSKESELLEGLILHLINSGQRRLVEDYFKQYWNEKYEKVRAQISARKSRDFSSRLEILLSALEDEGFSPRATLEKRSGTVSLKECHCPISAAANNTDIPCRMEARFIQKVLNAETKLVGGCEFKVQQRAASSSARMRKT